MDETKTATVKGRKKPKTLEDAIEIIMDQQAMIAVLAEKLDTANSRLAKVESFKPVNVTREKLVDLITESMSQGNNSNIANSIRSIFGNELRSVLRSNQEAHATIAELARAHVQSQSLAPEQINGIRSFIDSAVAQNLESGRITFQRNRL